MRAGQLRYRVEIQLNTPIANSYGEKEPVWKTVAVRRADVVDGKGREILRANQVLADLPVTVLMRGGGCPQLTPEHRIKFGDRILNIEAVQTVDRNREVILHCREPK
jgi:head-tail adaptor